MISNRFIKAARMRGAGVGAESQGLYNFAWIIILKKREALSLEEKRSGISDDAFVWN
jgi:hypothetical protein